MINSMIKGDIYQTELRGFVRSVRPSRALVTVSLHSNAKAWLYSFIFLLIPYTFISYIARSSISDPTVDLLLC
jgi:hypothetical protein